MAFRWRTGVVCAVMALSPLLLASCGGDGKKAAAAPSSPTAAPSEPASPKDPLLQPKTAQGKKNPYLYPPKIGARGAICGTAQNSADGRYALKVVRGRVQCAQVRTVMTGYFGYVQARTAKGYGYDGRPVAVKGWTCGPHVKKDVSGRSIDCVRSGSMINASILRR